MMATIDVMRDTFKTLELWLASQTIPCTHLREDGKPWPEKLPEEDGSYRCYACVDQDKPGWFTRFPTLRRECPCLRHFELYYYFDEGTWELCCEACRNSVTPPDTTQGSHGRWCTHCQGRGWLPNVTEEKLWPFIREVSHWKSGDYLAITIGTVDSEHFEEDGHTAIEAMLRAVVACAQKVV